MQYTASNNLKKGVLLIITAFFFFATMFAAQKGASGIPSIQILFFQYAMSFLIIAPVALRNGIKPIKSAHIGLLIIRSVGGACGNLLFIVAVMKMQLVNAVLLSSSGPLIIPLVALIWVGISINRMVWISLLNGLTGVCLIIKPSDNLLSNPASLIALSAAIFNAVSGVAAHKLTTTEPMLRILFYNSGLPTLLIAPLCFFVWKWPNSEQFELLCCTGVLYATGGLLYVLALENATAAALAPFIYSGVVFSGIYGWFFFKNVPDILSLIGMIVVIFGGILSMRAEPRHGIMHCHNR